MLADKEALKKRLQDKSLPVYEARSLERSIKDIDGRVARIDQQLVNPPGDRGR